jgi:hypothetical protein
MNRSTNECLKSLIKPEAIHHAAIGLLGTSRERRTFTTSAHDGQFTGVIGHVELVRCAR